MKCSDENGSAFNDTLHKFLRMFQHLIYGMWKPFTGKLRI